MICDAACLEERLTSELEECTYVFVFEDVYLSREAVKVS